MSKKDKLEEVIFFSLDQAVRKIKQYSQKRFDELKINITVEQWVLLKIIEANKEISQVDLAQLAVKDTASVTRMLDILEKKKLVKRNDHNMDRRKYTLSLTKEGNHFIRQHMPLVTALRAQGVKGISAAEVNTLKTILEKIVSNMS